MKLKVGDVVEFKKYEDMTEDEISCIAGKYFPKSGKIAEIRSDGSFFIEHSLYIFNPESVARVIGDVDDVDSFTPGEEVWVKTTVNSYYKNTVFLNPIERFVNKDNVLKIVKHETPERFIVQEDYYGMYIGAALELISDKGKAKFYTSRDAAIEDAAEVLPYDTWEVIPYDD